MDNFDAMYEEFERKYNKYPVQMSRCEAFMRAFYDDTITFDTFKAAREYFGPLWHYVGD